MDRVYSIRAKDLEKKAKSENIEFVHLYSWVENEINEISKL